MKTAKFRTTTSLFNHNRDNGKVDGKWLIGIDVGYSGVKIFSPNSVSCFPFFARKVAKSFSYIGGAPKESILYHDFDTDDYWLVGKIAQDTLPKGDTSNADNSLMVQDRFSTPMFKIVANCGLGIALISNSVYSYQQTDDIVIQTGLPDEYLKEYETAIRDSLKGIHHFEIKIADGEWMKFDFTVKAENIHVMSQPRGTLFSVCMNKDGSFYKEASKYLHSNVLVFDPGYGTFDIFSIIARSVDEDKCGTFPDLGMRRVFTDTIKEIKNKFGVTIQTHEIQKYLETGEVPYFNKKELKSEMKDFAPILAACSNRVCDEAIQKVLDTVNIVDYNYMIITGGTGAAWNYRIKEKLKNLSTLTILDGNQNDELPHIYANVRGYYYYRLSKLREGK